MNWLEIRRAYAYQIWEEVMLESIVEFYQMRDVVPLYVAARMYNLDFNNYWGVIYGETML